MDAQPTVSTYLVKPRLNNRSRDRLFAWRIRWHLLTTTHPKLQSNLILIVAGWFGLNLSLHFLSLPNQTIPGQNAFAETKQAAVAVADITSSTIGFNTAIARRITSLPGGPTGDLLPPGTLAPDRTYRNNYVWGNCTWYVAGRRPVPGDWGNASQWYYHATSSGWRVGSIPAVGAIAWTIHPTNYLGHVALIEQVSADRTMVYVSEMNVRGVGVKSTRWVPADSFKYIY